MASRMAARRSALTFLLALPLACARGAEDWKGDLDDPDPFVRGMAAIGLAFEAPSAARPALPELLSTIDRTGVGLQDEAARALAHVAGSNVPWLLDELVRDDLMSQERRRAILGALSGVGPAAVEPVLACLRGPGSHVAGDLGQVLLAFGPAALPGIVDMLEHEQDARLRSFAAFLLACMGPRARAALPALQAAVTAGDADLRAMASEAIASLEGRPWRAPVPGEAR